MADIGIMGGTFDPIHNGHLLLGRQAYEEYHLDEIWFMPSGNPPHKTDHRVTDVDRRCDMVRLAIAEYPHFRFSDFEAKRPGNTYTAQTLRLLTAAYPQHRFYFIIGADSLYEIEKWYHPEDVMAQTILLVAGREYEDARCSVDEQITRLRAKYGADIRRLHCEEVDISSGELREMEARGRKIFKYVPKSVEQYIERNGMYRERAENHHE